MSDSDQIEEASLLLGLQREKILSVQTTEITGKEAALESPYQENGNGEEQSRPIVSHADNSLCDLPNDNKTGADLPDNKPQDETKTHTENNTLESPQSQQPRELDSQTGDTVMEVDAADDGDERNSLDEKSPIEERDKEEERSCESIEMVQTTDKPKKNTEESSALDEHIEEKMETSSQMPGQEQRSSSSSMPENSSNMSLNKYKSLPGVISFEDMNNDGKSVVSLQESDEQEKLPAEDECVTSKEIEVDGGKFSSESESSPKPPEFHDTNKSEEALKGTEKDSLDHQKRVSVEFEEEESQNESIDEENDGRLFIDTGGESGDTEGEELSVKKKAQYVESPLAAGKLTSQQHTDSPLPEEEVQDLQRTVQESARETSSRNKATAENTDMVLSDKEVMLDSVDPEPPQNRSEMRSPMEVVPTSVDLITTEGSRLNATKTPLGAVIKVEQIDEGYGDSQTGDILDILHKSDKPPQKRKHNDTSDKSLPETLSFEPTEVAKRVKKEPVDRFESSESSCSSNTSTVKDASSRPQGTVTCTVSNSLLQLSKQVDSISTRQTRHMAPTVSMPSSVYPSQQSSLLRHQLNSGIRFPPQVSRISIPFVRAQQPAGKALPAPIQSDSRMRPAVSQPFTVTSATRGIMGRPPQSRPVMITTQTKTAPSLLNSTSTMRYRLVPHAGGHTLMSTSNSSTVTKPSVVVSSASSSQSSSTSIHDSLPSSSINIDTVGMQTITELIARKNPLPNYKVAPVPPDIKVNASVFTCYECGDTYRFSTSLETHRGRCSMKIAYKCEECKSMKIFFNKCQFLSHLRGHLNIEQTQAVPIHIKSDSISIEPLPKSHQQVFFQKFSVSKKTNVQKVTKRCAECGVACSQADFEKHFLGEINPNGNALSGKWKCVPCKLHFSSICAQRAHIRLHKEEELDKKFTCPECGIDQSGLMIGDQQFTDYEEKLSYHVLNVCFHLDKTNLVACSKCNAEFTSVREFKIHYFKKLEQYFKCSICPMAFRQQDSFTKHLSSQHVDIQNLSSNKKRMDVFKVIYRCHVCDSLIDDKSVLESHLTQHVVTKGVVYKCKECTEFFWKSEELATHFKAKHDEKSKLIMCHKNCDRTFDSWKSLLRHMLRDTHDAPQNSTFQFCGGCGFFYDQSESEGGHVCLSSKTGKLVVNKYPYSCKICSKRKFFIYSELLNHLESHQGKGYLVCKYCQSFDFPSKEGLITHESICSNRKSPFKPAILRKKKNVNSSSNHVEKTDEDVKQSPAEDVSEPSFLCVDCNEIFSSKADLNNHRKEVHSYLFPCHLCGLTYESQQSLRKHLRVSHEGKAHVYPCLICRKKGIRRIFTNVSVLEKHLASKHRVSKNQMSSSIVNEFAEEEDDVPNPPPKSIKSTSEHSELTSKIDSPVKRLHIQGDQVFNCAKCRFGCEDRSEFLEHLKVHKIDNSVQCLECGLCFAIIPSLRKHLFMVHKVKDFEEYCQKEGIVVKEEEEIEDEESEGTSYTSPAEESDQEDRDPLECRVCYRTFEDENKLRAHMRSHGMAFIRNKRKEKAVQRSRQSASISSVKSETPSENSNASSSDAK